MIFHLYVPTYDALSKLINCKLQIGLQFFYSFSNFEKIRKFSLSLKVGYISLHDLAMVIQEEKVSSNDNAKMFGQGGLFHNLY